MQLGMIDLGRMGANMVRRHIRKGDSWPLDLTADALLGDPDLSKFAGRVSDSGEGRWTTKAATDDAVPARMLITALYERFSSRGEANFANKLLAAMRY